MNRIWQGLVLWLILIATIQPVMAKGGKSELQGKYQPPTINRRLLSQGLSMGDNEREEYATNLAALAVKKIREEKGSQASLDLSRKLLGLALHLSPRNRKSVIVNRQLKDGTLPDAFVADYESDVFGKLLFARGQLLSKKEGNLNTMIARYFIELAASIDPRNEDAIYESEILRIDHGELSWSAVTDAKKK